MSLRIRVQSLALLSGLRIWSYHKLWCRWQTRLGSGIAVAVVEASSCSADSTPSLGTSICRRCGFKKKSHPEWSRPRLVGTWDIPGVVPTTPRVTSFNLHPKLGSGQHAVIPILQMSKWRLRGAKSIARGHSAGWGD